MTARYDGSGRPDSRGTPAFRPCQPADRRVSIAADMLRVMAEMIDRCRLAVELSARQILRIQRAIGASREQIVRTTRVIAHSEQLLAGMRAPDDIHAANRPELHGALR